MTKGLWMFLEEPTALFRIIMDATIPLSIGPNEVAILLIFFMAACIGFAYSKRMFGYVNFLRGQRFG
ncbi:MAG: hypothetical protein JSV58_05285 [Candidatus Bathyarchaeota archaeon]|nr:MAG: hypothetical protein JSV58_05285 [Candidatus Bathyarchaeota archaeon]